MKTLTDDEAAELEELEAEDRRAFSGIDFDLLDATLALILAEPDLHEQGSWFMLADDVGRADSVVDAIRSEVEQLFPKLPPIDCGSAACIAGWACQLAGETFRRDSVFDDWLANGRPIWLEAERLLGLEQDDANLLFDGSNTVDEIEAMVDHLRERGNLRMFRPFTREGW